MPHFGERSHSNLAEIHPKLRDLFYEVIKTYDCSIICGYRGQVAQNTAFHSGFSKVQWPDSRHNQKPSIAVDVMPYPIDWDDAKRLYHFVGYVERCARQMGIKVRSGADWDGDFDFKDQNFHDAPHWELLDDGKNPREEK